MTAKARELGMSRTVYQNASGLPDKNQVTTARDMARLGLALQDDFPRRYRMFAQRRFAYRGRRYKNHNRLLGRFPGTDGRRMSKSLGNTVEISASPEEIRQKLMPAFTDPARKRRSDPGNPEICAIYTYYQKFLPAETEQTATECRSAARGCVDCKKRLIAGVSDVFAPLRERRERYASQPRLLDELIADGCERAREAARATMASVHENMDLG